MIIAIDGPTASGKGTVATRVAERYRLPRLDTGAIYRAVALAVLDAGLDPKDEAAAIAAAEAVDLLNIDEARIRTAAVGAGASVVAAIPEVRAILLAAQRAFAGQPGGAVLDGRDIATVVCPEADVKLFVTADLAVRAQRRWKELTARGESLTLEALTRQIEERDARDANRPHAPLRRVADAVLIDTTDKTIEQAAAAAFEAIERVRGPS
jgi:cytidylate kinase